MSTEHWKVDDTHSSIHFAVRHLVIAKVHGQFRAFRVRMEIDETNLAASSVDVTIDASSLDTGNAARDADLRSERFFNAESFPTIEFCSRRVEPAGPDSFRVTGDLTMRDVTREVVLDVDLGGFTVDPWGMRRAGFEAKASLNRSDFGMVWNQVLDAGGLALGDRVDISIAVEAVSQAKSAA